MFTRIHNYLCFHPITEVFDAPMSGPAAMGAARHVNYQTNTLQDAYSAYLYDASSHAGGSDIAALLLEIKFEECLGQLNGTKTDADLGSVMEVMSAYG